MKIGKTVIFNIIFFIIVGSISVVLSVLIANVLSLVYSQNPEQILNLNVDIMIDRAINNEAVNKMFWIILAMFGLIIFASNYKRWFGLKDYKSGVFKVTDDIEIPVAVGDKQTQQGSSWWLSSKKFSKVFSVNTIDPENITIKKLLFNADEETKAINRIKIPKIEVNEQENIDEPKLKMLINKEYSKIDKKEIPKDESKVFKKGGIALGKRERKVFSRTSKFPFVNVRTVEDIYYVGDNVHTLTVRSNKVRKNKMYGNRKYI
ncbi:MAG: hypothetical protein J6A89_01790 [Clostridia bacterium]|nr:hypothetical protein [Clostridia bacterium]